MKIVFLCTGNVNRSAAAHAVALACGHKNVASCGTSIGARKSRVMARRTRVPLVAAGVPAEIVDRHRSRCAADFQFTQDCVVVGFQPSHAAWAAQHAPQCRYVNFADHAVGGRWQGKIPDPGFDAVIAPEVVNVIVKTTPALCARLSECAA